MRKSYMFCIIVLIITSIMFITACDGIDTINDSTGQQEGDLLEIKYKELVSKANRIFYCYPDKKQVEEKLQTIYGRGDEAGFYGAGKDLMCIGYTESDRLSGDYCTYFRRNPSCLGIVKKTNYRGPDTYIYSKTYAIDEVLPERFDEIKELIVKGKIEVIEGQTYDASFLADRFFQSKNYNNRNDVSTWIASNDDISSERIIICGGDVKNSDEYFFLNITCDNMKEIESKFLVLEEEARQKNNISIENVEGIEVLRVPTK